MPPSPFEELALRWVPGTGPVEIRGVASGLVNDICQVARAGRRYSLRVAKSGSQELGLDREWECKVLGCAASAGLAPPVEHCEPAQGILVAGWVSGRAWAPEEISRPETIDAMARLLRRVHTLPIPRPARTMSPAAWIDLYSAALARRGLDAPPGGMEQRTAGSKAAALRDAAGLRVARLAASPPPASSVLCHGDLHRLNVTLSERLVLFDWEFAHVTDPYWDLAGWVANNDWTERPAGELLSSYLQRKAEPAEAVRLSQLVWLYDYVCLLWSELYLIQRPGATSTEAAAGVEALEARLSERLGAG